MAVSKDPDQAPAAESQRDLAQEAVPDAASRETEREAVESNADSHSAKPSRRAAPVPGWVAPLYVGGLVLVYLGERVLSGLPSGAGVVTGLGLLATLVATSVRFVPKYRGTGESRGLQTWTAVFSVIGLLAVCVYFASTEAGATRLGWGDASFETREQIEGILTVMWVALLLLGVVPLLFAETALRPMRHAEKPEGRRVRAAAVNGVALVMAAIYGTLFVFAAEAVDLEVDYSYFKTSRPSESTKKIAAKLDNQVKVTAFFPQVNEVRNEVEAYLSDLKRGAPGLEVRYADRLLEPALARDLNATSDGVIILSKGSVHRAVNIGTDMEQARSKLKTLDRDFQEVLFKHVRDRRKAYLTVGHGELNDPSSGRAQPGRKASVIRLLLQKQNYVVDDLGLADGLGREVPDDADVVFILGPTEPFARQELTTLERYVDRGGKLFIALDPDHFSTHAGLVTASATASPEAAANAEAPRTPGSTTDGKAADGKAADGKATEGKPTAPDSKTTMDIKAAVPAGATTEAQAETKAASGDVVALEPLLAHLGLEFSSDVLANEQRHYRRRYNDSDRVILIANKFSSHPAVSTLSRNAPRAAVLVSGAGSLSAAQKVKGTKNPKIDFAMRAPPQTFSDQNRNYRFDSAERRDNFSLAAAVSIPTAKSDKSGAQKAPTDKSDNANSSDSSASDEARAFVLTDADALSDLIISQLVTNQLLLVDAVRWLGGEESFAGAVNTEEDVRIEHTKQKDLIWFYSTIFGVPAGVLGLGLALNRRSRKKSGGRA